VVLDKVSGQKSYVFDTADVTSNQVLARSVQRF
jgi:hypothetical protein